MVEERELTAPSGTPAAGRDRPGGTVELPDIRDIQDISVHPLVLCSGTTPAAWAYLVAAISLVASPHITMSREV